MRQSLFSLNTRSGLIAVCTAIAFSFVPQLAKAEGTAEDPVQLPPSENNGKSTGGGGSGGGIIGGGGGTGPGCGRSCPTPTPRGPGAPDPSPSDPRADAAADVAKGLTFPCPKDGEVSGVYMARAMQFCVGKVKTAFNPVATTGVATAACNGVQSKMGLTWSRVEECSN